jgi:hypothetical protein
MTIQVTGTATDAAGVSKQVVLTFYPRPVNITPPAIRIS